VWFAKMSSLARSQRISNIQIEGHWGGDRHVTLLHGHGGTLAGPDGVFGRHSLLWVNCGSEYHRIGMLTA